MDRSERLALLVSGSLMAFFLGGLVYASLGLDVSVPNCVTDVAPFTEPAVVRRGDGRYDIRVVARMWAFEPASIELPAGSEADLYVTSLDVIHGLYIEGTNVNLMAVPGVVTGTRVRFDRPGEHRVLCHEYCGAAHQYMAGTLVVRPGT
jgi:cytochrome c oxidase subunit II